jgi:hypothetical protein
LYYSLSLRRMWFVYSGFVVNIIDGLGYCFFFILGGCECIIPTVLFCFKSTLEA